LSKTAKRRARRKRELEKKITERKRLGTYTPPVTQEFKSRTLKLKLDTGKKKVLSAWNNAAKFVFNACLELLNKKREQRRLQVTKMLTKFPQWETDPAQCAAVEAEKKKIWKGFFDKQELRRYAGGNKSTLVLQHDFLRAVPQAIRDGAILDLQDNLNSNWAKYSATGQLFQLHFKRKRDWRQSFRFDKRDWSRHTTKQCLFPQYMKKALGDDIWLLFTEDNPRIRRGGRIIKEGDNFYITVNSSTALRSVEDQDERGSLVAIDPGVRSFLTCYDPAGRVAEFGCGDNYGKLKYRLGVIRLLDSKISLAKTKRAKRSFGRARMRQFKRIGNMVNSMHNNVSNWLVRNYTCILLPKLDTQRMVAKHRRKLRPQIADIMLKLAHGCFYDMLKRKCEQAGCNLVECTEEYTSKTCGRCGTLHDALGGNKMYNCGRCGYNADRDVNGARNILLKYVTDKRLTRLIV
jgi:transposase